MSGAKTAKELQEIFERVGCPGRGRRFDLSILRPEQGFRTMLERHKRAAEIWLRVVRTEHVPTMGPVHFDYIENWDLNAFASEWDNHDFVGVYVGAMIEIYGFFGSLLANPKFLLSIGNPFAEVEWISETFDPRQLYRQPKDATRRMFAGLMATIAIDFLFAHEIGHLMNGHVKLLNKRKGTPLLAEFGPILEAREENLTLQTLEMDADCFAVAQGLTTAFGRAGDPGHVFPPDWRQWYGTPGQALFSWTLAIYGFFRLFFKGTVNLDDLDSTNHPPPNIRLSMVLNTVEAFLRRARLEELILVLEPTIMEVLQTVETGYAAIMSTPLDLSGINQALDPRANRHVGRLLDQWKILRPDLIPLSRGGRLAD